MGFKCGIVGLPNVGKSTLFNALTNKNIAAENYPFCTINPNQGLVQVPDKRLDAIAQVAKSKKIIPTFMEFVDIAGLVKGASKGEGLGNMFLSHIRQTDAIAKVVRCFTQSDVIHVHNKVDPVADIETILLELILADLEYLERQMVKLAKICKANDKLARAKYAKCELLQKHLLANNLAGTFDAINDLTDFDFLTAKPIMVIANTDESKESAMHFDNLTKYCSQQQFPLVAINAKLVGELNELDATEKQEYLQDLNLEDPINTLISAGYSLLDLHTYFTAGPKEARAWTIPKNTFAPKAASKIHTDIEKGFIRAEVINYADYIKHQGEQKAKEMGALKIEGKDYIVCDGDIINFRFNV